MDKPTIAVLYVCVCESVWRPWWVDDIMSLLLQALGAPPKHRYVWWWAKRVGSRSATTCALGTPSPCILEVCIRCLSPLQSFTLTTPQPYSHSSWPNSEGLLHHQITGLGSKSLASNLKKHEPLISYTVLKSSLKVHFTINYLTRF